MAKIKKNKLQWQLGTVHWFDKQTGEGIIKDQKGRKLYVHYSAIESNQKWKKLKDASPVKFTVVEDLTEARIAKVKEI